MRLKLRKLIVNWLFSGILIRILIIRKWLRRFLRRLARLMLYLVIRRSEPFMISMARLDLILHKEAAGLVPNSPVSKTLAVSATSDNSHQAPAEVAASPSQKPMKFSEEHSAEETHSKTSSATTTISSAAASA